VDADFNKSNQHPAKRQKILFEFDCYPDLRLRVKYGFNGEFPAFLGTRLRSVG